jgi:hypothetical protein
MQRDLVYRSVWLDVLLLSPEKSILETPSVFRGDVQLQLPIMKPISWPYFVLSQLLEHLNS